SGNNWHEHVLHPDPVVENTLIRTLGILNDAVDRKVLPQMLADCEQRKGPIYRDCPYAYACPRATYASAEVAAKEATPVEALAVIAKARPVRVRRTAKRPATTVGKARGGRRSTDT